MCVLIAHPEVSSLRVEPQVLIIDVSLYSLLWDTRHNKYLAYKI
jgi:hypothetical protein